MKKMINILALLVAAAGFSAQSLHGMQSEGDLFSKIRLVANKGDLQDFGLSTLFAYFDAEVAKISKDDLHNDVISPLRNLRSATPALPEERGRLHAFVGSLPQREESTITSSKEGILAKGLKKVVDIQVRWYNNRAAFNFDLSCNRCVPYLFEHFSAWIVSHLLSLDKAQALIGKQFVQCKTKICALLDSLLYDLQINLLPQKQQSDEKKNQVLVSWNEAVAGAKKTINDVKHKASEAGEFEIIEQDIRELNNNSSNADTPQLQAVNAAETVVEESIEQNIEELNNNSSNVDAPQPQAVNTATLDENVVEEFIERDITVLNNNLSNVDAPQPQAFNAATFAETVVEHGPIRHLDARTIVGSSIVTAIIYYGCMYLQQQQNMQ